MTTTLRGLWQTAIAVAAIGFSGMAIAQVYPSKTIRFVITYPTGGGSDFTVRPIAQKLSEHWGQPVIVDSRPGGSAMIGTDFVVRSAPDGYRKRQIEVATDVAGSSPEALGALQKTEIEKYRKIAVSAGIKPE
jgi:tripartite-type tricarboxylate transporter receptor subunit TctC